MMRFGTANIAAATRKRPDLLIGCAFALLVAALFFDPLFVPKTFAMRDLVPFFFPIEKAVHAAWRSGHLPLILPEISFGRPLAANPNAGVFYPVRVAMALFPFSIAVRVFPIFHCWLAAIGAFLLARFLGVSRAGSALAGAGFAFSGPTFSEFSYFDFLPGLAMMPFVILAAGSLARRPSRRHGALFALCWGVALLAGDVFTVGLAFAGAILITAEETPPPARGRTCLRLLAASVPGFLIASIQLLPTALFVPETVRALGRMSLATAFSWSVSPWRFLELAVPFAFGDVEGRGALWGKALWYGKDAGFFSTLHCGVLGLTAMLGAVLPRGRRMLPYGLLALSLLLAVPGFFLPKSLAGVSSPIPLRYPEKFLVGMALAFSLAVGYWFDGLRRGEGGRSLAVSVSITGALLLILAATRMFPSGVLGFVNRTVSSIAPADRSILSPLRTEFGRAAIFWAAATAVIAGRFVLEKRHLLTLAIFLVALGNGLWLRSVLFKTYPESEVLRPLPTAYAVRRINHGETFAVFPAVDYQGSGAKDIAWLNADYAALHGIACAFNTDYDVSDLFRVELARRQLLRQRTGWPGVGDFLGSFSARTAVEPPGMHPVGFPVLWRRIAGSDIFENPDALPRFRFALHVTEVPGVREAYRLISGDDIDLSRDTVVETGASRAQTLTGGRIVVEAQTAAGMRLRVRTNGPARLVLPLTYFPYRRVVVDDRVVESDPTNLCLTSIMVPPGSHEVAVEERLPGGAAGPLGSLAGLAIVAVLLRGALNDAEQWS